ncbi:MAG: ABC transporter ATP-binding protein [Deltaproteobacteria bacterium]|nr:ABC transporter ATP-binding protein [Deltaproteobacteria bacterium]
MNNTTIKSPAPALTLPYAANFGSPSAGNSLVHPAADPVPGPYPAGSLVIEGVSKTFDSKRGKVLDSVSLTVLPDTFFALLGPSGCGKSTLLRLIAGLEYPDEGRIILDNIDITNAPPQARPVNTVFQSFALFPHLTVYGNIIFGLKAQKALNARNMTIVHETISALQLDGLEKVFPDELSGGQQQRVALARALVNQPKVLLLDEPMSHLDDYLKSKVGQDLQELQRRLKTIFVMVAHDREDSMTISSDMAILHDGRIVQHAPPKRLFSRPNSVFVAEFMGKANVFPARRSETDPWSFELPFLSVSESQPVLWEKAMMLINPDALRLSPPAADVNFSEFKLRIEQARYRGYHVELVCSIDNAFPGMFPDAPSRSKLQVLTADHAREWVPGDDVTLYLDHSEIVILECQGEPAAFADELAVTVEQTPASRPAGHGDMAAAGMA